MLWKMKRKREFLGSGVAMLVLTYFLMSSVAYGETLFNNLNQTGLGQGTLSNTYYKAQKFTTDNQRYTLDSVTVRLRRSTQGNLFVKIYDDDDDLPKQAVGTLNAPSVGPDYENHKLTPQGVVELMGSRTYWVVVGVTSGAGRFDWNYTASNVGAGVGFSTRWAYTTDAGASWNGDDGEPFIMEVMASPNQPIPTLNEWGLIILSLLFVASFCLMRRNRKEVV